MNIRKITDDNPVWREDVSGVPLILPNAEKRQIAEVAERWLNLTVAIYRARNRRTA